MSKFCLVLFLTTFCCNEKSHQESSTINSNDVSEKLSKRQTLDKAQTDVLSQSIEKGTRSDAADIGSETSIALSEEEYGKVLLPPFDAKVKWMHERANPDSIFYAQIDDKETVAVSRKKGGFVDGLELNQKHKIVIRLNGKAYESFKFDFEKYESQCLVIKYKADHGPWVLLEGDCDWVDKKIEQYTR